MKKLSLILILFTVFLSCSQPKQQNSEYVHIPDEKFAGEIKRVLKIETDQPIPLKSLQQLTEFHIHPQREIIDLTGLEKATALKSLHIGDNYQIYDISPLSELKNLTTLGIYGNAVHDLRPLSKLTQLKKLYFNRNHITDISPIEKLNQLTELYIGENPLNDINPLTGLTELEKLTIIDTNLVDITPLANLTKITRLILANNRISDISRISNLTNLTVLDLQQNNISDTTALGSLSKLTKLWLNDNPFTEISSLANLKQLENLQIYDTNTSDVTPLAGLSQLKYLNLHNTNIRYLSPLEKSTHLRGLTFYNTLITDITPLVNLTNLRGLAFHDTDISDLSPLSNLTELVSLSLNENNIRDLSPLSGLRHLTELELHKNQISDISPLSGLTELTKLRLDGNNITDITPLAEMKQLTHLGLEKNLIRDISTIENFTNLSVLHIKHNPVGNLTPIRKLREQIPELNTKLANFPPVFATHELNTSLPTGATARLGKGGINVIKYSPDGKKLVVGSDIGLWIYDALTGKLEGHPKQNIGQVNALAFSRDGKYLASGGNSNPVIQVLDMHTGVYHTLHLPISRTINFKPHKSVHALTFSRGGTTLISVDETGYVTHWDVLTGRILTKYHTDHDTWGNTLTLNNYGTLFARGYGDGEIWLRDPWTNKLEAKLRGHKPFFGKSKKQSGVMSLAFSPDQKYLASGSMDKTLRVWKTKRHRKHATFEGHTGWVTAITFSPDSKSVASGCTDNIVRVWDTQQKRELAALNGHTNTIVALTFSPDKQTLASASADGTIRFWDTNSWTTKSLIDGHTEWVRSLAFSDDGTTVFSAMFNNTVNQYDVNTGKYLNVFNDAHQQQTYAVQLSPNGSLLGCHKVNGVIAFNLQGTNTFTRHQGVGEIHIWDIINTKKLPSPVDAYGVMAFSPDNAILSASSSENISAWSVTNKGFRMSGSSKQICLWDVNTGEKIHSFNVKSDRPNSPLDFSPDGSKLASSTVFESSYLWDLDTRQNLTNLLYNGKGLAFSPNGSILAIRGSFEISLWNITSETEIKYINTLSDKEVDGKIITFSPDGKILLVEGAFTGRHFRKDVQIRLYDVETGEKLLTLYGHTEPIETLVFSPDGKTLASGSEDGTVLLWDWNVIQREIVLDSGSEDDINWTNL